MKIGIYQTKEDGESHWGEKRYGKLKEYGYDCVDFNMADTDSFIYTSSREEADAALIREKELAAEAGIEINQVHGPWRWPARDFSEEDRRERMEKMKESIRMTAVLGCKNWVIHPIMPFGTEEAGTEDARKTWDMNISFMSELLKTAKEYDVTICLENMPMLNFSLSKPADILRFVRTINDEHFKICLDTGHVSVFQAQSAGDAARELGDEIRVLHVHDNKVGWDLHMFPYFGIIDWEDFAKALKDIEFDGVFSLETRPPEALPDELYEEQFLFLNRTAKEIIKNIR